MSKFVSVEGTITNIEAIRTGGDRQESCCTLIMSVRKENKEVINFIVDNDTYFIDNVNVRRGDNIIAFYDSMLPTPMIYPPQYRAIVMARQMKNRFVKVAKFNRENLSDDGSVRLNINRGTRIIMRNNQDFLCNINGKNVAIVYSASTRSYPAIIIPSEIIVLCR